MSAFVCKLPINVVIIIIRSLIDSNSLYKGVNPGGRGDSSPNFGVGGNTYTIPPPLTFYVL